MRVNQFIIEDWQKANKKDKTDGMSQKAVNAYRRENPGSKLKTAVTTKPSKLKKGSKASKRRSSYCSRSKGQMDMHNISCAKEPDKAICKARRRWNCEEDVQHLEQALQEVALGTIPKRPSRLGSRPDRGHEPVPRYQLDELSAETIKSYKEKATKQVKELEPHAEKGEYKDIAKRMLDRRKRGLEMANKRDDSKVTEDKKGLYYYVNKRKKAGTSRSKGHPDAPSAQDWKNAAKTAKSEDVAEAGFDYLTNPQHPLSPMNAINIARSAGVFGPEQSIVQAGLSIGTALGTLISVIGLTRYDKVVDKFKELFKHPKNASLEEIVQVQKQIKELHKKTQTLKSEKGRARAHEELKAAYEVLDELKAKVKSGVAEGKIKGVDGKACWKGKRYAGKVKKADGTYKDKCVPMEEQLADLEAQLLALSEEGKASRKLCTSSKPDDELGASQLASCKSQGLRSRDGNKSHKLGKSPKSRIKVGGHKIKGHKYGGPLPDWS